MIKEYDILIVLKSDRVHCANGDLIECLINQGEENTMDIFTSTGWWNEDQVRLVTDEEKLKWKDSIWNTNNTTPKDYDVYKYWE